MSIIRTWRIVAAATWLAATFAAACSSEQLQPVTTSTGGAAGAGGVAGGAGGSGGGDIVDACAVLGLPVRPFADAVDSSALYATAADLTIPTTDGDYQLADRWTGCDAMLFIQDVPRQNTGNDWPTPLWDRDVDTLIANSPHNARYFFVSVQPDQGARDTALAGLKVKVDEALANLPPDEQSWWLGRIHYVPVRAIDLPGWLGSVMLSPGWGVAIDRFQAIRYIGSYADPARYSQSQGWFAPNLSMAANEVVRFNYEADRQAHLDAENATVVHVFAGGPGSDGSPTDVTLPDAATMAGFDSMELDLTMGCIGDGELGDCPAWDYMAYVYLCDDPQDPNNCAVELGRWITTYHREGRWVHDVSGLLPLLADGGTKRLAFSSANPYEVKLDIRLFNAGKAAQPSGLTYLYDAFGTPFDASYNDAFQPMDVPIPADATKVELGVVVSGHGQNSPGNCAEFCVTTHHFFANGTENVVELSEAGSNYGCMDQVDQGTIPNQYGTWWYGRSGWCPGKEVPLRVIDITDQVTLGATNTFDYEGYRNGAPYTGTATIKLRSWLMVSK